MKLQPYGPTVQLLVHLLVHLQVLYCTVLYCTVLYSTIQYSTGHNRTAQYSTVQYRTEDQTVTGRKEIKTVHYSTVQYSAVQYSHECSRGELSSPALSLFRPRPKARWSPSLKWVQRESDLGVGLSSLSFGIRGIQTCFSGGEEAEDACVGSWQAEAQGLEFLGSGGGGRRRV